MSDIRQTTADRQSERLAQAALELVAEEGVTRSAREVTARAWSARVVALVGADAAHGQV